MVRKRDDFADLVSRRARAGLDTRTSADVQVLEDVLLGPVHALGYAAEQQAIAAALAKVDAAAATEASVIMRAAATVAATTASTASLHLAARVAEEEAARVPVLRHDERPALELSDRWGVRSMQTGEVSLGWLATVTKADELRKHLRYLFTWHKVPKFDVLYAIRLCGMFAVDDNSSRLPAYVRSG